MHRTTRVLGFAAALALLLGSLVFGASRPAYAEDPRSPTPTPTSVPEGTDGSGGGGHPGG